FDLVRYQRVCLVDNPGVRIRALDSSEASSNIFSRNNVAFDLIPDPKLCQKFLCVDSSGNRIRICQSEFFHNGCIAQFLRIRNRKRSRFRDNDYQSVAEKTFAAAREEAVLGSEKVHFCFVSREKEVSRSTGVDLTRQFVGPGKIETELVAGGFCVNRLDLVQRISQADRSKEHDFSSASRAGNHQNNQKRDRKQIEPAESHRP